MNDWLVLALGIICWVLFLAWRKKQIRLLDGANRYIVIWGSKGQWEVAPGEVPVTYSEAIARKAELVQAHPDKIIEVISETAMLRGFRNLNR